jgi:hypothetical protein
MGPNPTTSFAHELDLIIPHMETAKDERHIQMILSTIPGIERFHLSDRAAHLHHVVGTTPQKICEIICNAGYRASIGSPRG